MSVCGSVHEYVYINFEYADSTYCGITNIFITLSAVNTHVHVQYMEDHICLTSQTICIYSNRFSAALQKLVTLVKFNVCAQD